MNNIVAHDTVVWFSKSFGLIYLMVLSAIAVAYACWPSKKAEFDRASNSILRGEDKP